MGEAERIARRCRTALGLTLTIERLWQNLKSHYLAGFITNEHEALDAKVEESIRTLLGKPENLRSVCKTHSE
jgi:hypothetical protein